MLKRLSPTRLVGTVKHIDTRNRTVYIVPDNILLLNRTAVYEGSTPERGEKVRLAAYGDGWKVIGRNLK